MSGVPCFHTDARGWCCKAGTDWLQPGLDVERFCVAHRVRARCGHADRAAALEREDTLSTRRGGAAMAEQSAHAALLRTQDVRCDILVAGADH